MEYNKNYSKIFQEIISENNITAYLRNNNKQYWNIVFERLSFRPFNYNLSFMDYICEYEKINNNIFIDLSLIFFQDNKPIAISPIFLFKEKNEAELKINLNNQNHISDIKDFTIKFFNSSVTKDILEYSAKPECYYFNFLDQI